MSVKKAKKGPGYYKNDFYEMAHVMLSAIITPLK